MALNTMSSPGMRAKSVFGIEKTASLIRTTNHDDQLTWHETALVDGQSGRDRRSAATSRTESLGSGDRVRLS